VGASAVCARSSTTNALTRLCCDATLLITLLHVIVVTSLLGRFSAGANANILWSVGVKTRAEAKDALARLQAAGMDTIDVSSMPSAQVSGLLPVMPVP